MTTPEPVLPGVPAVRRRKGENVAAAIFIAVRSVEEEVERVVLVISLFLGFRRL
jgi:hypothetical protein